MPPALCGMGIRFSLRLFYPPGPGKSFLTLPPFSFSSSLIISSFGENRNAMMGLIWREASSSSHFQMGYVREVVTLIRVYSIVHSTRNDHLLSLRFFTLQWMSYILILIPVMREWLVSSFCLEKRPIARGINSFQNLFKKLIGLDGQKGFKIISLFLSS